MPAEPFVVMVLRECLTGRIGCNVLRLFDTPDVRRVILGADVCMCELNKDTLNEWDK